MSVAPTTYVLGARLPEMNPDFIQQQRIQLELDARALQDKARELDALERRQTTALPSAAGPQSMGEAPVGVVGDALPSMVQPRVGFASSQLPAYSYY